MSWEVSLGIYPGILLGMRSYRYEDDSVDHVFYLPFVEVILSMKENEIEDEEDSEYIKP